MSHDDDPQQQMPQNYENPTTNYRIAFHSPHSLVAQFVLLMQSRFEQVPDYTYRDSEEDTDIYVSTEYNHPEDIEGEMPLISVGRGTNVAKDPVVGNRDHGNDNYVRHGGEYKYGRNQMDIQYRVLSQKHAETEIIGDIIQSSLQTGKYIIKNNLLLQDIGPIAFQPPTLYDGDYYDYAASIQFRITIEQRWFTLPPAPVLTRIETNLGYNWDDVRRIISEAADPS